MAKPDNPGAGSAPGQADKPFVVVHPTDPSSPRTVTQEEFTNEHLASQGWKKQPAEPEGEPKS